MVEMQGRSQATINILISDDARGSYDSSLSLSSHHCIGAVDVAVHDSVKLHKEEKLSQTVCSHSHTQRLLPWEFILTLTSIIRLRSSPVHSCTAFTAAIPAFATYV